jgi:hypothetical protein
MPKTKKKTAAKAAGARVNKSAWIRSQPASMSAKDVVEKAKGESIKLSLAQVYTARSTAKHKQPGTGSSKSSSKSSASSRKVLATVTRSVTGGSTDLRHQFVSLAVRIGTDEAQRLLDRLVDVQTSNANAAAR